MDNNNLIAGEIVDQWKPRYVVDSATIDQPLAVLAASRLYYSKRQRTGCQQSLARTFEIERVDPRIGCCERGERVRRVRDLVVINASFG
jgi:hypothetical protein